MGHSSACPSFKKILLQLLWSLAGLIRGVLWKRCVQQEERNGSGHYCGSALATVKCLQS